MEKVVVVMGVIGEDAHNIGLTILRKEFSEAGFEVVNVGVQASQEKFIQAAIKNKARAIIISSLYGQAELDCRGLRKKCIEAGLDDILLYIGGNLAVGKKIWREIEARFRELGFDRVYPLGTSPSKAIKDLRKDLKLEDKDGNSSK